MNRSAAAAFDPVLSDLNRHLSQLDADEAQAERADYIANNPTPSELSYALATVASGTPQEMAVLHRAYMQGKPEFMAALFDHLSEAFAYIADGEAAALDCDPRDVLHDWDV